MKKLLLALGLLLVCTPALAGDVPVRFETTQATVWGESVYVLGDLPELGAGDLTRAPRMVPGTSGDWSLTVALPAGQRTSYSFWIRSNAADHLANPSNGRKVSGDLATTVPGVLATNTRRVTYLSGWSAPVLRYQHAANDVRDASFRRVGPGRGPGESTWLVEVTPAQSDLVFLPHDGNGGVDRPQGGGVYSSRLSQLTVQDGRLSGGATGAGRVWTVNGWYSHNTGNARQILIYLPPGYDGGTRRYPVLYMHDGQNLFGPDALFGGWRVEETCDRLINAGEMEPTIIVGVGNTPARMSEYIPEADGGEATKYGRFLVDELKPWVDRTLRTRPGREDTGVAGSSLGGLVSVFLGWKHPGVFGRVASLSGSFWLRGWVDELERSSARPDLKVWLDSGNTGNSEDSLENTLHVRDVLLRKGYALEGGVAHFVDYGASHTERFWRARFDRALRFLFPPR